MTRDLSAALTRAPELVLKPGSLDAARGLLDAAAAVRQERALAAQVDRARAAAGQLAAEGKAGRFAAEWRQLEQRQEKLVRLGDRLERQVIAARLGAMEMRLKHDPGLAATMKARERQLGVSAGLGRVLRGQSRERSRDRGFGLEL